MKKVKIHNKLICLAVLLIFSNPLSAQTSTEENNSQMEIPPTEVNIPNRKRIIEKFEIFAGPSISFNYGNRYLQNFEVNNISNRRLLKPGYTLGLGITHSLTERIGINARLQYEQKGRKTELIFPVSFPVSNESISWFKDYTYNYMTLAISPIVHLGSNKRVFVSAGPYLSRILSFEGYHRDESDVEGIIFEGCIPGRIWYTLGEDGSNQGGFYAPWAMGINSYDLGMVLSVGYVIPFRNDQLTIQLIDNIGLSNINYFRPYGQAERNHTVQLLLGYSFLRTK